VFEREPGGRRSLKTQQHAACPEGQGVQIRSTWLGPDAAAAGGMPDGPTVGRSSILELFPRKEVIQPQLPLRLPCYDFTPVTSPTFDGSLPCGLGHRLRVLLTSVV
jgi:hypothetical protein